MLGIIRPSVQYCTDICAGKFYNYPIELHTFRLYLFLCVSLNRMNLHDQMPRNYGKRPWQPEEDNQLREMVEAGKTITMISLRLKRTVTAVRGRLGILKVPLGKVGRRPKKNPPA